MNVMGTTQRLAPGCPSGHRSALLPAHTHSSGSHARKSLCPAPRRDAAAAAAPARPDVAAAAAAKEGGSADSSSKRVRSRHYYESTPRYKSKGGEPSVTDAVADALSASFGGSALTDLNNNRRSSSNNRNSSSSSSSSSSISPYGSRNNTAGRRKGGVSTADNLEDADEEEEEEEEREVRGWWEVPREQRQWGSSGADLQLLPWQEEQLLLAAASSKKKMQVQTVAANVGLDRTQVLAWVQAFRAKPKTEQTRMLWPLQQQIQRMRAQQQQQSEAAQAAEAARRDRTPRQQPEQYEQEQQYDQQEQQQWQEQPQPRQQQQQQQGLPFSGKNPDTGFVPFTERRAQQGMMAAGSGTGRVKRLPGEVLRTLEGVYARSPWPNKEVVAGLFDLHRLNRDVVMEWFAARRDMDGLPDNPRAAKQLAATAKRALQQVDSLELQPLLPAELLPPRPAPPAPAQQQQLQAAADTAAAAGSPQQQQQQQQQRMQSLTARQMAALRSGLPSPRKQKGEKLKQELGIKAGPDASKQLEISGVTFVAKDGRAGWRNAWRARRSVSGLPAQQLDFNLWLLRQEQQGEKEEVVQ